MNKDLINSDEQANKIAKVEFDYQSSIPIIFDGIAKFGQSMSDVVSAAIPYTTFFSQGISSLLASFFQKMVRIDFSPMFEALRNLNFNFDFGEYEERYLNTMYESRWFPYAGQHVSFLIIEDINNILRNTRQSKNRVKKIDACIFSYYNDKEIEQIKRDWRSLGLSNYLMRILQHAVKAYKNKEYAVTTIVLQSLWEGIVAEKAAHPGYRTGRKTKETFSALILSNEFPQIFSDFYDDFIMYDCNSADDVIDDVPGRHGISHGWYTRYPSRKAALNAILFTDLLLQLKPVKLKVDWLHLTIQKR